MSNNQLFWSRYNFLENIKGKYYLYNSFSNCLLDLDDELYGLFRNMKPGIDIDESLMSRLGKNETEYFINNFIFSQNDDDLVEILHNASLSRLYSQRTLVLTICPTLSCNFACTYCFEHNKHGGNMSDEVENAIVKFVKNRKDKDGTDTIRLTWFGGEPLLCIGRIASLTNKLNSLNIQFAEKSLITNGWNFTPEVSETLYDVGINDIQITLDGDRDRHNSRRPLINGAGTYDRILGNLDKHFSGPLKNAFTIAIRVNTDKNNIDEFVNTYKKLHSRYKSEHLIVYPGIVILNENDSGYSKCLSKNEMTNFVIELYKQYGIQVEEFYPDNLYADCMARSPYSNLVVCEDGTIYKCYEHVGNKTTAVGNILDENILSNPQFIARYSTGIDQYKDPECRACPYLPICTAGCPTRRYENKYEGKGTDCCTPFKGRMSDYIELVTNM